MHVASQIQPPGVVQVGHQEEFLYGKGCQALKWAAQGGDGVTTLGGVQEMTGCDTQGHGLVHRVLFSHRLGSILEVLSNLNDSVIL